MFNEDYDGSVQEGRLSSGIYEAYWASEGSVDEESYRNLSF